MTKSRAFVAVCLMALGLLAGQAAGAHAAMYWGATIDGETYGETGAAPTNQSAWNQFESHADKKVGVLNTSQAWIKFEAPQLDIIRARGAIPMVTMELGEGITLADVAAGKQDAAIKTWAQEAKAWGHPFLFNPWWEMNGDWYSWGRDPNFVAAWRHFHDLVVAQGATNVTWTWTTNSLWSDPASDPGPYYPGDSYVDWIGIDSYNWGLNPAQPDRWTNPDQTLTPTLERVDEIAPGKPVAIIEDASSEIGGNKTDWIREMLTTYLPHHPEIKAYLWFNWNFQKPNGRADWPIESSAPAQEAFRSGIQMGIYQSNSPVSSGLSKVQPPPPIPSGADPPEPLDLSPGSLAATSPQAAVADDGFATVVWSASNGANYNVYERRIAPDGTPEATIHQLSAPSQDAFSPQVAVAPDGTAVAVWIRSNGTNFVVQARRIAPDGTVEASTDDLSSTGQNAAEPQIAIAPDGTSTVVWKRFDGSHFLIKERRIAPDGTPDPTPSHTLSATGQDAVEPQVALAPDGTATVAWSRFDGTSSIVQESRISPDGTPDPNATNLSATEQNAVEPEVVTAPDGTATVVWVQVNGSNSIVQARRISASGAPEPSTDNLSASGQNAVEPQLAVAFDSAVTAVWERFDGADFIVQERRIAADGTPEPSARNLSSAGADAVDPQVGVAPDGGATVVWSRFNGSSFVVQERNLAADGNPGQSVAVLSTAGRNATAPQIALGSDGARTTVWTRFDGANDVVQGQTVPARAAALTPASYDFGSVSLDASLGANKTFEVANVGSAPLVIYSIFFGGPDASQFGLGATGRCTDAPIVAGASCQFSAAFEPSVAGSWQAHIDVVSNSVTSPDVASLSGKAVALVPAKDGIDNSFTIGKPILNRRRGTALLPVIVPGPGTLSISGAGVSTRAVHAAGVVKVRIAPQGRKKRQLARSGKVSLKVKVTFVPSAGTPNSQTATLRLREGAGPSHGPPG